MPNATTVSLLVTDEERNEVPDLGGTNFELEEYQSPLERLIAHSTSEQRGDSFAISAPWSGRDDGNDLAVANNANTRSHQKERMILSSPISSHTSRTKPSLVTLAACTCCLLQMGFVWASFLSPSWLDTRLYLSISLPSIQIEADDSQLLHSTTLGSLLGDLLGADQHLVAVALILTSLVLPCLCVISGPVWIAEDRKERNKISANNTFVPSMQRNCFCPRMFIEYSAKIGFSIFFILCTLDVGTSPLEIEFKDSRFIVVNQIKGGVALYTLGMLCGLSVLALLRFDRTNFQRIVGHVHISDRNTSGKYLYRDKYFQEVCRNQGFERYWEVHPNELFTGITYSQQNRTEEGYVERHLGTSLLQNEYTGENTSVEQNILVLDAKKTTETLNKHLTERIQTELGGLSFWKRIILYELALLSTVLWIPAVFLPLFHLEYEGIVSEFMPEVSYTFRLKDFPVELWERGISADADRCMLFVLQSSFVLLVFVCPVMANLAALGAWIFDTRSSTFCKCILWILQPFLGALVFGTTLYFSIPAFETVAEGAIDKVSSGICTNFKAATADACFAIEAEPSMGLWFLLVESLALELFVVLTLTWKI